MTENKTGMTRRTFIKGALAASVTAAVPAPGLLSNVFAAGPNKGGAMKLGLAGGSTTDSLDPGTFSSVFDQMTSMGLYRNPFLELDKNGELQPELVTEWSAEPGAKAWNVKLRQGVEFHTHDLATVRAIADDVVVMYQGKVVEYGPRDEVFNPPHHDFTELLLSSVPEMDPDWLDRTLEERKWQTAI